MATLVTKNQVQSRYNMVKLQLVLHDFFNNLKLPRASLDCATILALKENNHNNKFLKSVVEAGVYGSEQSVRNCMGDLEEVGIVVKENKLWKINPELKLGIDSVICLQLKAKNNPE